MKKNKTISKSFYVASNGLKQAIKKEKNLKIHCIMACLSIIAGLYFQLSTIEFCIILICISLIISLELINTAIEYFLDLYSLEYSPTIKTIKDISAAAVFFSSIVVFIIGCLIFLPKCIKHIELWM